MGKDLIMKNKIIEKLSINLWNIWKCDGIINLKIKKDLALSNILPVYLKAT